MSNSITSSKLRVCYLAAKTYASVIIRLDEESTAKDIPNISNEVTTFEIFFSYNPDKMVAEYK